jgi:predicted dehydrogenase
VSTREGSGGPALRVAVIGCGGIAMSQHGPAYQKLAGVEIVAGSDVSAERAAAFVARFGGRAYTDYREMLARERPVIVDVCTPEDQHVEPTIAALEAGADVLCEKIMAHTLAGGRAMVAAAARTGRFLGIDYNYRFFPIFQELKRQLTAGELGELALLTVAAHAFCFHHAIDLLRWLGGPVEAVSGQYTATVDPRYHYRVQCPDFVYVPSRNASLVLRFASGALGVISASRFEDLHARMLRVEAVGEKGRLTADGITIDDIIGRLVRWPGGEEVPFYDGAERGFNVAFERSIRAFIERVRGAETDAATGEDGYAVLEIEHALVRANAEGRVIALPLTDAGGAVVQEDAR